MLEVIFKLGPAMSYMKKKVVHLGYEVTFNPPGDGDCFYASAAKALGIGGEDGL